MNSTSERQAPVGRTDARHRALASVSDGLVFYSRERAQWVLRSGPEGDSVLNPVTGSPQRTLRDLLDRGLIERVNTSGQTVAVRVTGRGMSALDVWGSTEERLGSD